MSFLNKSFKSIASLLFSSTCNWWYQGEFGFCCRFAVSVIIQTINDSTPEVEDTTEDTVMIKIMIIIDPSIREVGATALSIDPGEVVVIIIPEDKVLPHPEQMIHNIKEYHNTNMYVASATTGDIMTINVTLFSICFMQCNYKMDNKIHKRIQNMTITIRMTNRLFRRGIPQP